MMMKLLLVLVLAGGVGVAQSNPLVTKYPDIEVEWMRLISLRFEVCYDEEPRVNYTFKVHFILNSSNNEQDIQEGAKKGLMMTL